MYPMVDTIDVKYDDQGASGYGIDLPRLDIDIFLNDKTITKDNMYDKGFDPHYLVDVNMKKYYKYFDIDKVKVNCIVWGPDGNIIYSWEL
jgi:hypothetical protein